MGADITVGLVGGPRNGVETRRTPDVSSIMPHADAHSRHHGNNLRGVGQHRLDEILGTALDLFSRFGFHGTSMRDIGDAVGLDKSSLYNYLTSKEELLTKLLSSYAERHFNLAFAALDNLEDPQAAMERLIEHLVNMGLTEWRSMALFVREQANLPADVYPAMMNRGAELLERIKVCISAGVKSGQFRPDLDADFTALAVLGQGYAVHTWAPMIQAHDPSRLRDAYKQFAMRGLLR